MGHYNIRLKVRRRKVADLAAKSRKYTVNNCTIKKDPNIKLKTYKMFNHNVQCNVNVTKDGNGEWKEQKHPQPEIIKFDGSKYIIKKMNNVEYMEKLVKHKLKKWEKNNPCPIKQDDNQKDLFETEYLPKWEFEREKAEERIRDFVVSVYDKLQLVGRYKTANKYKEQEFAKIKDVDGEGHIINELNPKKSKLIKNAKTATNKEKKTNPNLVASTLKDHRRRKGRIILPDSELQNAA